MNTQGSTALDELAMRVGVEDQFFDARGQIIETTAETKRRLLATLGFHGDGDAAIQADLAALNQNDWRGAPPVCVCYEGEAVHVDLVRPVQTGIVHWTLTLEDGERRSGDVIFRSLAFSAARDLNEARLERRLLVLADE